MGKIPVGRVIGETFRFSFGKYFTLLGLLWLPTLVIAGICYLLLQPFLAAVWHAFQELMRHPESHGAQNMLDDAMMSGLRERFSLVQFLLTIFLVVVQVAITKEILGLRKGPRFVYLSMGSAEAIAVLANILLTALTYAAIFAAVLVGLIVGLLVVLAAGSSLQNFDAKTMAGPLMAAFIGFAFVAELAFIYAVVRLSFFLAPVAVAEKRIGLIRSWELTKGNFWRIVAIWLVVLLPLFLVEIVFLAALVLPGFLSLREAAQHGGHVAVEGQMRSLVSVYMTYLPWMWLAGFVLSPIFYGLWMAPAAFAYRALVPQQFRLQPGAEQPPPPEGGDLAPA